MKNLISNLHRNRHFLYCLLTAGFLSLSGCGYVVGYSVKQEVREMKYSPETNLVTYVWGNGKIIKAWYDDIDKVDSSLVRYRQAQADSLIVALKACR